MNEGKSDPNIYFISSTVKSPVNKAVIQFATVINTLIFLRQVDAEDIFSIIAYNQNVLYRADPYLTLLTDYRVE